jgi:hypothetical protein
MKARETASWDQANKGKIIGMDTDGNRAKLLVVTITYPSTSNLFFANNPIIF